MLSCGCAAGGSEGSHFAIERTVQELNALAQVCIPGKGKEHMAT
jgi:hypothetical protein